MTDLDRLIDAVEREVDTAHHHAAAFPSESAYGKCTWHDSHKASSGSLDAAKALHEALLPGYSANIWMNTDDDADCTVTKPHKMGDDQATWLFLSDVEGNNPARAWLIAILKASRSQCPAKS